MDRQLAFVVSVQAGALHYASVNGRGFDWVAAVVGHATRASLPPDVLVEDLAVDCIRWQAGETMRPQWIDDRA
jgi:hypothetical protein